jgi:hypothetical protein
MILRSDGKAAGVRNRPARETKNSMELRVVHCSHIF